jgi:DNA-binding MarR family transcriptional regulator
VRNGIGYQLKRAHHALRLTTDEVLRSFELTTPQYSALNVLKAVPGLSGAALARQCFVTPQTMNEIIAHLEAVGLITRQPHPEHGRILQAYLTPAGEQLLIQADQLVAAVEKQMVSGLSQLEALQLEEWLRLCSQTLLKLTREKEG